MTFAGRVSAFFLIAMALALAGYSAIFYFVARHHLYEQFDSRLQTALDILAASVEVEFDDAKWQPLEHGIRLDRDVLVESRWIVADENGQTIDRSAGLERKDPQHAVLFEYSSRPHVEEDFAVQIGDWRILHRQLNAPAPKPVTEREPHEFASVRITVARSAAGLHNTMRQLSWATAVLPAAVWLVAAALGRRYIGRTLRPVRAMAERARAMGEADFALRMPVDNSRDELSALGEEFNRLLDRLQRAYERQRRFAGDAAHQLRTPLTVIQGQIDVARRKERTPEDYRQILQLLAGKVCELNRIVDSLLFMARSEIETGKAPAEQIRLNDWLASYAARWSQHERATDFSFIPGEDAMVWTSPALLSQVLDNLINNAFAYSRPGSAVVLRSQVNGPQVVLCVEDRGIGISPEDMPSIFSPFFRSAEAGRTAVAGTGLGLAIAARIAAVLGGSLSCESTPGAGSAFTLTLPAHRLER